MMSFTPQPMTLWEGINQTTPAQNRNRILHQEIKKRKEDVVLSPNKRKKEENERD